MTTKLPTERLKTLTVRRYMATRLMTFAPELHIAKAIEMLVQNRYTGAPVLDPDGRLIGMLSEKDCLRVAVLANAEGAAAALVGDYMTTQVDSVTPETTLFEVAERFVGAPYKRLPVVEQGRLVGQISRIDVLRAIDELLRDAN
jgi:CBS domain-containing protein